MAQAFDAAKLQFIGEAFPVAEQVGGFLGSGLTSLAASSTGLLAYRSGTRFNVTQLT